MNKRIRQIRVIITKLTLSNAITCDSDEIELKETIIIPRNTIIIPSHSDDDKLSLSQNIATPTRTNIPTLFKGAIIETGAKLYANRKNNHPTAVKKKPKSHTF